MGVATVAGGGWQLGSGGEHQPGIELAWAAFLRRFHQEIGLNLAAYKGTQLRRRVEQWMERHGELNYFTLLRRLRQEPEARQAFIDYLGINTTSFFRDPTVFATLERVVLPDLLRRPGPVRIWSAASSIGAEAYSIAMLLAEKGALERAEILATDIDQAALEQGRSGRYTEAQLTGLSRLRQQRYFRADGTTFVIDPDLRRRVRFERLDLLADPYPSPMDLILCRNLFIYLAQSTQAEVTGRLVQALQPGGYLVLGGTEYISDPARFGLKRVDFCVYQVQVPAQG